MCMLIPKIKMVIMMACLLHKSIAMVMLSMDMSQLIRGMIMITMMIIMIMMMVMMMVMMMMIIIILVVMIMMIMGKIALK